MDNTIDRMDGKGKHREKELFDVLVSRFGKDCVYLSPKFRKTKGTEKELADIIVLAVPYILLFQLKWSHISDCDLAGEDAKRMQRRLESKLVEAARQFKTFCRLWAGHSSVLLPQVFGHTLSEEYELPLEEFSTVIPIVVVDFEDAKYQDPMQRYVVPPIVEDVPPIVQSWGCVHAFLLRDIERIIEDMFTVGDLITYLKLRERQMLGPKIFFNYSEMDLFASYILQYNQWKQASETYAVSVQKGIYELMKDKLSDEFKVRKRVFEEEDALDRVVVGLKNLVVNASKSGMLDKAQVSMFLGCSGRLRCLRAVEKKQLSDRLIRNIQACDISKGDDTRGPIESTFDLSTPLVLSHTAFHVVASVYADSTIQNLLCFLYVGGLNMIKNNGKGDDVKEIMLILANARTKSTYVEVRRVSPEVLQYAATDEQMAVGRKSSATIHVEHEEWAYVQGKKDGEKAI